MLLLTTPPPVHAKMALEERSDALKHTIALARTPRKRLDSAVHEVNVFHHHPGQPITLVSFCQEHEVHHQRDMSQQQNAHLSNRVDRIQLVLSAYTARQFQSLRHAAKAFNVPHSTLTSRYNGTTHMLKRRNGRQKLTATEEQTIIQYILDLDSRGFAPRLCEVADMADKLLGVRGGTRVGKCWAERFVTRSDKLKMAFNRAKDRQRIFQEDPEIISA
jgi:hypothetical protein